MPSPALTEPQIVELREILALVTQAWERYRAFSDQGLPAPGRDSRRRALQHHALCEDRLEDATGERLSRVVS